jgi:hypothetical protein
MQALEPDNNTLNIDAGYSLMSLAMSQNLFEPQFPHL